MVGDVKESVSLRTVAEHEDITSPRMRIGNFNVAGIARSNYKSGVDVNESTAIFKFIPTINVANVSGGVHVAVVNLIGGGQSNNGGGGGESCGDDGGGGGGDAKVDGREDLIKNVKCELQSCRFCVASAYHVSSRSCVTPEY